MDYIGEHLLPGQIGHLFVILSFVASIIASVAYFISARSTNPVDEASWKKLGRAAFFIDAISNSVDLGFIKEAHSRIIEGAVRTGTDMIT